MFTERVAVAPLNDTLRNATPDVGAKLKEVILVAEPFTVTVTFCDPTCPPEGAINDTEGGLAATPLPVPEPLPTVRLTVSVPV